MTAVCYVRFANRDCLEQASQTSQAEIVKKEAEQRGFKIVDTGSSRLDAKILSLLTREGAQLNQAVITFRG